MPPCSIQPMHLSVSQITEPFLLENAPQCMPRRMPGGQSAYLTLALIGRACFDFEFVDDRQSRLPVFASRRTQMVVVRAQRFRRQVVRSAGPFTVPAADADGRIDEHPHAIRREDVLGAAVATEVPRPAAAVPTAAAVFKNVRRLCAFMGFPWAGLMSVHPEYSRIAP
jgi:hypothetical protein